MKVFEVLKESEWENTAFTSRMSEIAHLEGKRKALMHQRKLLYSMLMRLLFKGIIVDDPSPEDKTKFVVIPGTGTRETNYSKLYAPPNQPEVFKFVRGMERINTADKQYLARIKEITIKGHTFCFTGFRDASMENTITKLGGRVVSSAIKGLDFLVAENPDKMSGKMLKAREQGTKIVSKQYMDSLLRY